MNSPSKEQMAIETRRDEKGKTRKTFDLPTRAIPPGETEI